MQNDPRFNVAIDLATRDLVHFDSVGVVYVMSSGGLPGAFKVGTTVKPLMVRAAELSVELNIPAPFVVRASWRFRNYRLAERFLQHHLYPCRQRFVKGVEHFTDLRTGSAATRTHRSTEIFACEFDDIERIASQLLEKHSEVYAFEREVAGRARKMFFRRLGPTPEDTKTGLFFANIFREMSARWERGETSIQLQNGTAETPASQGNLGF